MYAHAPAGTLDEYIRVTQFETELFQRVRRLPGVVSVAGAMGIPTGEYGSNGSYVLEGTGTMQHHAQELPHADFSLSSPDYFSTMGIPRLRGRDFTDADRYGSKPVVIISEALARQSFPNEDPIGRRLQCGLDAETMQWMTIVGVVGNVRQDSPASPASPAMYMPLAQHPFRANEVQVAIRTEVDPSSLIASVKRIVEQMNPQVATKFTTMDAMVGQSVADSRFRTTLALSFAALALLLAIMGVYAVMNYVTVQRTSEFAIRAALGAPRGAILRLVLRGAARLAAAGVVAGAGLAIAASRALASLLFGLKSTDTLTYVIVVAVVVPAVLLAALRPALRASRVDPLVALRDDRAGEADDDLVVVKPAGLRRASLFMTIWPRVTCPSPPMAVWLLWRTARMVVERIRVTAGSFSWEGRPRGIAAIVWLHRTSSEIEWFPFFAGGICE